MIGAGLPAAPAAAVAVTDGQTGPAQRASESVAGLIGRAMEPVIAPLGFDWRIGTALIGAFAAKEVFVAQMGILYATDGDSGRDRLWQALRRDYSPATGLALMVFLLVATPCMATLAVVRRESGSWRWPLLQMGGLTLLGYLLALLVYQAGRLVL
jgi:ferrous iron transport protein B